MRLIDADKVKALIKGPLSVDTDADKEYVCGLIDKIEGGWISVKDRMPRETGECLVFTITKCVALYWFDRDNVEWFDIIGCNVGDGYVTHWMTLPDKPEEG